MAFGAFGVARTRPDAVSARAATCVGRRRLTSWRLAFAVPAAETRRRPPQRRSEATYEAVVEAAAQVFERHGDAAGTTNRIAERAGVSIGSLHQDFADKDAMLVAVCEQHLADGARTLPPPLARLQDDPEPEPAVRAFLTAMVDLHRDRPRLHRLLFEEAPLTGRIREQVLALEAAAAHEVAAWLAGRGVDDPELTARLLVEAVEAWTHRFVLHPPDAVDEEAFLAVAARLLAAGIHQRS